VKISARNRLEGRVVEVRNGRTTAYVRIDVAGTIVTAAITSEAVDELGLRWARRRMPWSRPRT
jgi:molybdopterin-binding protein